MSSNESYVILKFGNMHPDYIKPGISLKGCLTISLSRYNDLVNEARSLGSEGEMSFVTTLDFDNQQNAQEFTTFSDQIITDKSFKKEVKCMGNRMVLIAECNEVVKQQPFTKYANEHFGEYLHSTQSMSLIVDIMPKVKDLYDAVKAGKASALEGSYIKLGMNADSKFLSSLLPMPVVPAQIASFVLSTLSYARLELDMNSNLDSILPPFLTEILKMPWSDMLGELLEKVKELLVQMNILNCVKGAGPRGRAIMCIPPCFALEFDLEIDGIAELLS